MPTPWNKNASILIPDHEYNLRRLYEHERLTTRAVAAALGVSQDTVRRALKRLDIPIRGREESHRIYNVCDEYFDVIDTPNKAYVLGFLCADGCNRLDHNIVSACVHWNDRGYLQMICRALEYTGPIRKSGNTARFEIRSSKLAGALAQAGCPPAKSLILTYPPSVPVTLNRDFIRGYFDGDGCISAYRKTNAGQAKITGTVALCKEIAHILEREVRVTTRVDINPRNPAIASVRVCGKLQLRRLAYWMYHRAQLFMARKRLRFDEITA